MVILSEDWRNWHKGGIPYTSVNNKHCSSPWVEW